ncbi:hypothetical protein T05_7165 [Trichinella murrelli]|uniref:Uncharacterized protein n=1 Tax=Trichinella murrelli TaxID=144512 RepID=A0A0V0TEF2_9BILA|nr:hypothetical protein T05_7165 [Trichinella murrelli]
MPSSQNCRSMWLVVVVVVVVIEKLFTSLHTAKTPFNNQPDAKYFLSKIRSIDQNATTITTTTIDSAQLPKSIL